MTTEVEVDVVVSKLDRMVDTRDDNWLKKTGSAPRKTPTSLGSKENSNDGWTTDGEAEDDGFGAGSLTNADETFFFLAGGRGRLGSLLRNWASIVGSNLITWLGVSRWNWISKLSSSLKPM